MATEPRRELTPQSPLQLVLGETVVPVPCQISVTRDGKRVALILCNERNGNVVLDLVDNPSVINRCGS